MFQPELEDQPHGRRARYPLRDVAIRLRAHTRHARVGLGVASELGALGKSPT